MAPQKDQNQKKQVKFYFVYFIIFTIIILLIFAYGFIDFFWNYWAQIRQDEAYYRGQAETIGQNAPQINAADPIKGPAGAKVTVFEYTDFFCPGCQILQNDLASLEAFYGSKIRFVFKGLPFSIFPENRPALNAAYCANEQNAFWQYKKLLFADTKILNEQKYREYASQLNLDLDQFSKCLTDRKYYNLLNQNMTDALGLQITSVPTVYVNDQKLEGYINVNTLKNLIDSQL